MSNTQVNLRLSIELKERIDLAAKENNRSLNSELVTRLENSFAPSGNASNEQQSLHNDYLQAKDSLKDITRTIEKLKELLGH